MTWLSARRNRSFVALALWIFTSLLVAYFHEPWRDEAQAWLVAKSASSFFDLVFRASMEASGLVYYLLLWPWAKVFPEHFPSAIFWVSWTGTLCFAIVFLFSEVLPEKIVWLVLFGYLFGYEYAVLSRLYGWGCFFLWWGITWDLKRSRLAWIPLSLACLVQLNFVFAAGAWCSYRVFSGLGIRRYLPVLAFALLSFFLVQTAAEARPWNTWVNLTRLPEYLGTTLSSPFIHGPHLEWAGYLFAAAGLYVLSARARLAFLVGLLPFAYLFTFRYSGWARTQHAGALFLVWLALLAPDYWKQRKGGKAIFYFFLFFSLLSGLVIRFQDVTRPFSDGILVADRAKELALQKGKPPRIYVPDEIDGFVVSARLGIPYLKNGSPMGCPFFDSPCTRLAQDREQMDRGFRPEVFKGCGDEATCFLISRYPATASAVHSDGGKWERVFEDPGALRESLWMWVWQPATP